MKSYSFFTALLFSTLVFISCDSDITDMGNSVLPAGDQILVGSEAFDIKSENYVVPYMISMQDSFLLGTFYDETYGTTHADILAQVKHPDNFTYHAGTTPDSVYLIMYYTKYFGDKHSPMHISVYEMTEKTFKFPDAYKSDINPDEFCNKLKLLGKKTVTAVDANKVNDSTAIAIKLSSDFLKRFSDMSTNPYRSDDAFQNFFKGLYITTDFGSATMLYLSRIEMEYYHHYTYQAPGILPQNNDSTYTVNNIVYFPANNEVRQVNRFLHPDTTQVKNFLTSQTNQIHYISSPANVYTRIKLPLKNMQEKLEGNGLRLAINDATIRVDIANIDDNDLAQPLVSNILLIKESQLDDFFINKEFPNDSSAILGTYAYSLNSDTDEYDYYYSFDIDNLITHEFKNAKTNNFTLPVEENYLLVPVRVKYDTSKNITEIGPQYLVNAVTICGGNHNTKPIKARVVFSGF